MYSEQKGPRVVLMLRDHSNQYPSESAQTRVECKEQKSGIHRHTENGHIDEAEGNKAQRRQAQQQHKRQQDACQFLDWLFHHFPLPFSTDFAIHCFFVFRCMADGNLFIASRLTNKISFSQKASASLSLTYILSIQFCFHTVLLCKIR